MAINLLLFIILHQKTTHYMKSLKVLGFAFGLGLVTLSMGAMAQGTNTKESKPKQTEQKSSTPKPGAEHHEGKGGEHKEGEHHEGGNGGAKPKSTTAPKPH